MAVTPFNRIPAHCTKALSEMHLTKTQSQIMNFVALRQYDHRRDDVPNTSISYIAANIGRSVRGTADALLKLKAMRLLLVVESNKHLGDKLIWNENTLEWPGGQVASDEARFITPMNQDEERFITPMKLDSSHYGSQLHHSDESTIIAPMNLASSIRSREEDLRSEEAKAYAGRVITYPTIADSMEDPNQEEIERDLDQVGLYLYQEIGANLDQAKAWQRPDNPILWGCVVRLRALWLAVCQTESVQSPRKVMRTILASGILHDRYADRVDKLTAQCECDAHQMRYKVITPPKIPMAFQRYAQQTGRQAWSE